MKKLLLISLVFFHIITPSLHAFSPAAVSKETVECGKIMGGSILAAVLYGLINDQITARICPEYFTQGFHRQMMQQWDGPVFGKLKNVLEQTKSPTVIGGIWGVVATWWMGALLGVPVTIAARAGSWPQLTMKDLVKPVGVGLGAMGASAFGAGLYGYYRARSGKINKNRLQYSVAHGVPDEKMDAFIADAYAHNVGYLGGALTGLGILSWVLAKRYALNKKELQQGQMQAPSA